MKRYFKIGTEFIIHDGESNILIFTGSEGDEKHFDATLDPHLNLELNAYTMPWVLGSLRGRVLRQIGTGESGGDRTGEGGGKDCRLYVTAAKQRLYSLLRGTWKPAVKHTEKSY